MWQTTRKKKLENNPNHAPKGSSKGGQFTKGDGGSGSDDDKDDTKKDDKPKSGDNSKSISKTNNDLQSKMVDNFEEIGIEWENNAEKLVSGFSRNTDPNSSFSDIEGAWKDEIKKHPELQTIKDEMDNHVNNINSTIQDKFNKSESLWRGTSPKEIDRLLDKGVVEPYQYNFISYTLDKEAGMGFGKNTSGITVEYDKNIISNQDIPDVKPVKYTAYSNYAGVGEDKDREYPIGFSDEMEVRSNWFKGDKSVIKSLTIHKDKFDDNEFNELQTKYKEAGIIVNIKESTEDVALSGDHSRADIGKKKKKRFEFNEALDEHWIKLIQEVRYRAFTHSSSFVGNVKYDQDEQSMEVILNGKTYDFCNVSERLFDAFEGADSKGAFFNREIKTLHDC